MRLAVAFVLLLALLPLPVASAASWTLDARVSVQDGASADYTWTIGGLSNTNLTLPLPDNATFVEARDAHGRALKAGVMGDKMYVVAESSPFTIRFLLTGQHEGPFVVFPAQVAADASSPVTVALAMPAGWTLAGYRDNEGAAPDTSGVFRKSGPAYVQFLVLPAGIVDEGPDLTVTGSVVKREGRALVREDGVSWTLTTTYDTDTFRREWDVHVPEGARVLGASTPFGALAASVENGTARVRTPYPVGYGLGARAFTVEMLLPPPEAHGGAFRQANMSVRAAEGDIVRVETSLADGMRYAGARVAGGTQTAPLRFEASGPLSVGVAFLPRPAPGHVQLEEGRFVVDAPEGLEAAARATARNASAQLPRVASFAYDPADERPFFVAYTSAPIFGWEKGFYSNGLNTISIRAASLDEAQDGRARLAATGVLVHEATHGLIDRMMPDAPHDLSLLHEGLARLAETRLEDHFPASEIVTCERQGLTQQCERHSARPALDTLRAFHQAQRDLDASWTASRVPESERGFLYDYSGLVMHAYDTRAPVGALDNALAHVARTTFTDDAAADARTLLDILLLNAPGATEQALLYPGRELNAHTDEQFRFCMGALLAPGYPWEPAGVAPPGGCPATGYGARAASLPPPPAPASPSPTSAPTPVASPRPTFEVPTSFPTPPPPPDAEAPSGQVPAGAVAPADAPGSTAVPVPGVLLALVVALVAVLLPAARRR